MHALLLAVTLTQLLAGAKEHQGSCWGFDDDDPHQVVCEAVEEQSPDAVVHAVAQRLGVSDVAAAVIVEAELRLDVVWNEREKELPQDEQTSLDRRLRAALKERGKKLPLLITLGELLAARSHDDDFVEQMFPLLRTEPNAIAAIIRMGNLGHPQELYAAALEIYRNDPDLLAAMAECHPLGAAFGPALIGPRGVTLRPTFRSLPTDVLAQHANAQIDRLLSNIRGNEALALFDLLPEAAQSRILRMPFDISDGDARLGLAAAAALAGDEARARAFLKSATPRDEDDLDFDAAAKIVETSLQPHLTGDVFDVIIAAAKRHPFGAMGRLYASLLERGGYSTVAAQVLRDQVRVAGDVLALDIKDTDCIALLASIAADAEATRARTRILEPETSDGARLRHLLQAPRLAYFRELPMPADVASGAVVLEPEGKPAGFVYPVRTEQYGGEIVVLGMSPIVDPVPNLESGGYWLLRSQDGGETWSAHYTGLRSGMPYVAVAKSRLPLLDGDHVHIEVETNEKSGIYIDLAWDDMMRDSDLDGVTDLVEERLVLDPHDPDTDDDGVPDGADMLPFVPRASALMAMSTVLGSIFVEQGLVEPPTQFVVGSRAMFAPLTLSLRTIVLSAEERELYEKKFGPFYGTAIRMFAIDHSGTRAIIELDHRWAGETLLLRKEGDRWVEAETLSSWISLTPTPSP